jgi:hypothetical protein
MNVVSGCPDFRLRASWWLSGTYGSAVSGSLITVDMQMPQRAKSQFSSGAYLIRTTKDVSVEYEAAIS